MTHPGTITEAELAEAWADGYRFGRDAEAEGLAYDKGSRQNPHLQADDPDRPEPAAPRPKAFRPDLTSHGGEDQPAPEYEPQWARGDMPEGAEEWIQTVHGWEWLP